MPVSICSVVEIRALTTNAEVDELFVRVVKSFETSSVTVEISGISKHARERNKSPLKRRIENLPRIAFMEINLIPHCRYRNAPSAVNAEELPFVTAGGAVKAGGDRRR